MSKTRNLKPSAGRFDSGRSSVDQSHLESAVIHFQSGEYAKASALLAKIKPTSRCYADVVHLQGTISYQSRHYQKAIDQLSRAHRKNPNNAQLLNTLASSFLALGQHESAIQFYQQALKLTPDYDDARSNLSKAQKAAGRSLEAAKTLQPLYLKYPGNHQLINQVAQFYLEAEEYTQALEWVEKGLGLQPNNVNLLLAKAFSLQHSGDFEAAREAYQTVRQSPGMSGEDANAVAGNMSPEWQALRTKLRHNLSIVELTLGRYSDAWSGYRSRPSLMNCPYPLFQNILPQDLKAKSVLVVRDQGLGDELFFLRYIEQVVQRGARVAYLPHEKLRPLLASCSDLVLVEESDSLIRDYDYIISVADLPFVLGPSNIVPQAFALKPDTGRIKQFQAELSACGPAPYVGLTWRAGLETENTLATTLRKHIGIGDILTMLSDFKGTLVVLQRHPQEEELQQLDAGLNCVVADYSACNESLSAMLALQACLTDVIGVSNTNVHLRGSLGLPAAVLVPSPPEWRWGLDSETSAWYPGFEILRQQDDSWKNAGRKLRHRLEQTV